MADTGLAIFINCTDQKVTLTINGANKSHTIDPVTLWKGGEGPDLSSQQIARDANPNPYQVDIMGMNNTVVYYLGEDSTKKLSFSKVLTTVDADGYHTNETIYYYMFYDNMIESAEGTSKVCTKS